jgi:hypothetical protein
MQIARRLLFALAACGCATLVKADCAIPRYVWELELSNIELLEGAGDVDAEAEALGPTATLEGPSRLRVAAQQTLSARLFGDAETPWDLLLRKDSD